MYMKKKEMIKKKTKTISNEINFTVGGQGPE